MVIKEGTIEVEQRCMQYREDSFLQTPNVLG